MITLFLYKQLIMNKSIHFIGQPILSQLLKLIDRSQVNRIAKNHKSDRYYKPFKTWEHLVTMLYATFSNYKTLRELSTGLLACEGRLFPLRN